MRRSALFIVCLGLMGCAPGPVRESVGRVTLPKGLEITWPAEAGQAEGRAGAPVVLRMKAVGRGPVVVCFIRTRLRAEALRRAKARTGGLLRTDDGSESRGKVFVRQPEPGRFRYDGDRDCVVAEPAGGSPFSLSPAFRWYDVVLHPGGAEAVLELGRAEPGSTVQVFVEYLPLSYRRLARAGYVAPADLGAAEAPAEGPEEGELAVRFDRLSEAELRRRRPSRLFLRSEFLPPLMKGQLEIPPGEPR